MKKKIEQERKLEKLLLESIKHGDSTPLTKKDFEEIKRRGMKRLKDKVKHS